MDSSVQAIAGPPGHQDRSATAMLVAAVVLLLGGAAAQFMGRGAIGDALWIAAIATGVLLGSYWVVAALRHGRLGVDVLAVMALLGTVAVGEYLAGAIITLMLATGRMIEARAGARAERELRTLLARAPRIAHRIDGGAESDVSVDEVLPGDVLRVRAGEVLPVDGTVLTDGVMLDESALTGEPLPVEHDAGSAVCSGCTNAGDSFELRARTSAASSTYAGVIALVRAAQEDTAPFVRLADRYALWFVGISIGIAGGAWLISGDAVRAVAVLVVATPCPLILAAPVAIVAGLSRSARVGVLIKGGGVLERLGRAEVLLLDKTGTLTEGHPSVVEIIAAEGCDEAEVLALAAAIERNSPHVLGAAVVAAARDRGIDLEEAREVEEVIAHGVQGRVGATVVRVGKASWILDPDDRSPWCARARRRTALDGALSMYVAVDGTPIGAILLEDRLRADAPRTIRAMRASGIRRVVMVTGDRADVAESVGAVLGVDAVFAERTPAGKLDVIAEEVRLGHTLMVGDGLNDAPALALADVGVAIGARGVTAASEVADVVLIVDRLDRLAEGLAIARRSLRLARQSVILGISLSFVAMGVAAAGYLPPVWGALLQEAIDMAVILNALRAVLAGPQQVRLDAEAEALVARFRSEHRVMRPELDHLRGVADEIGVVPDAQALRDVRVIQRFLATDLIPHEQAEDRALYPVIGRALGGTDPTGSMSRAHVEIAHLSSRLDRVLEDVDPLAPDVEELAEIRRLLYGLHAILRLHFAQEDEGMFSLSRDEGSSPPAHGSTGSGAA